MHGFDCGFLGTLKAFPERANFQSAGWLDRVPPQRLIHFDDWRVDRRKGNDLPK
jgi:hypothetical protein